MASLDEIKPSIEEHVQQDEFELMVRSGRYFMDLQALSGYTYDHIQTLVAIERVNRTLERLLFSQLRHDRGFLPHLFDGLHNILKIAFHGGQHVSTMLRIRGNYQRLRQRFEFFYREGLGFNRTMS